MLVPQFVMTASGGNPTPITVLGSSVGNTSQTNSNVMLGGFSGLNDTLSGSLVIDQNYLSGGSSLTLNLNGQTVADMIDDINNESDLPAVWIQGPGNSGSVQLISNVPVPNGIFQVDPSGLTDTSAPGYGSGLVASSGGQNGSDGSLDVYEFDVSAATAKEYISVVDPYGNDTNPLTGSVTIEQNGVETTINAASLQSPDLLGVENAITGSGNFFVRISEDTSLQLGGPQYAADGPMFFTSTLEDPTEQTEATGILSGISSSGTLTGTLKITIGNNQQHSLTLNSQDSLTTQATQISASNLGVNATVETNGDGTKSLLLTSKTTGTVGDFYVDTTDLEDPAPENASLNYTASSAYSMGLTKDAVDSVYDSTTGQTSGALATFTTDINGASSIATISYTDAAGQNLSGTNLLNQTNAQSTLTSLNTAISDVAAQDGYIGAQINTLDSVGSVLSSQQENVIAAQNAVKATDYALATSNMSKYEILMQASISALAQANSMQQEVTKLLQ